MDLLLSYFSKSTTLFAVVLPLIISSFFIFLEMKNKKTDSMYYILFLCSIPLGCILSAWRMDTRGFGLTIPQTFLILSLFCKKDKSYTTMFFLCFFSTLTIDFLCMFFPNLALGLNPLVFLGKPMPLKILYDLVPTYQSRLFMIGGKGILDALLIFPTLIMLYYFLILRLNTKKDIKNETIN